VASSIPEAASRRPSGLNASDVAGTLVTGSNTSLNLELKKEDGAWKVEEYQGQAAR
jgi:hypothetical protein